MRRGMRRSSSLRVQVLRQLFSCERTCCWAGCMDCMHAALGACSGWRGVFQVNGPSDAMKAGCNESGVMREVSAWRADKQESISAAPPSGPT